MSKRIINFEEGGNNGEPKPQQQQRPVQMQDLLDSAQEDWRTGNKNKAFITLVGAMAFISQGVAQAMRTSDKALEIARKNCGHRYDEVGKPCVWCDEPYPKESA